MRREGVVGEYRTNHTVRTAKCGPRFPEDSNKCLVHSKCALEFAYHELCAKTGKTRFSRLDLFEEAIRVFNAEGPYRTKHFACAFGKGFRKANRSCSCPQCTDLTTTKTRRQELRRQIHEDLQESVYYQGESKPKLVV